jgi:Putative phage tail protein
LPGRSTGNPLTSRRRPDAAEALGRVALGYIDRQRDYLNGAVTAATLSGGATSGVNTPLVLDLAGARNAAEYRLANDAAACETLDLTLPPSLAALERVMS